MSKFSKFLIFFFAGLITSILVFSYIFISNTDFTTEPGVGGILVFYIAIFFSIPSFLLGGFIFLYISEKFYTRKKI